MQDDPYELLVTPLHRIAPDVDLDEVDRAAPLQEVADLDSMDFLNLMSGLYDETGIEVPVRDYPAVASVDGFVSYSRRLRPRLAVAVTAEPGTRDLGPLTQRDDMHILARWLGAR